MESTRNNLLSWEEISKMVDDNEELNPIDQFIYDQSPAGESEYTFRVQLFNAVNYEDEEEKTERNVSVVNSFMEHCKENGIEIPDSLFESYFDA